MPAAPPRCLLSPLRKDARRAIAAARRACAIDPERGLPVRTRRAAGRSKRCEDGLSSKERRWERTWGRTVPRYRTWSTRNSSVVVECQDRIVTYLRLSKKVPKDGLSQGPARRSCSCNLKLEGQDQACFSHTNKNWTSTCTLVLASWTPRVFLAALKAAMQRE